jgi:hypothetical protein
MTPESRGSDNDQAPRPLWQRVLHALRGSFDHVLAAAETGREQNPDAPAASALETGTPPVADVAEATPPTPWPRLSESLTGPKHPHVCQSCGREYPVRLQFTDPLQELDAGRPQDIWGEIAQVLDPPKGVYGWQEHGDTDSPEPIVVMLCTTCSDRLIVPHPRLYRQLAPNEPFPGVMELCLGCRFRTGVRCTHPALKANGGPGLKIEIGPPDVAMVHGVRGGQKVILYRHPAKECAGREPCEDEGEKAP